MLTPAEKQKRYRERQKAKRLANLKKPEAVDVELIQTPFSDWVRDDGNFVDFELYLALAGIEAPQFDDDRGPEAFVLNGASDGVEGLFKGANGSAGRAEAIVGCLIDAAVTLAGILNKYKRREIEQRISELEKSDMVDPAKRTAAFKEAVRLNKLLDQLDTQVRWSFPQWKVSGV